MIDSKMWLKNNPSVPFIYMSKTYGVVYSKRQNDLFVKWAENDLVTEDEKSHHNRIVKVQGYGFSL